MQATIAKGFWKDARHPVLEVLTMGAISGRTPAVVIEYTSYGKRVRKLFEDAFEARRFYAYKFRAGAEPKVLNPDKVSKDHTMPTTKKPAAKKPATKKPAKAKPATKSKAGTTISGKGQAVLAFLQSQGATTAAKAIDRRKVWSKCEVGMSVIATLKSAGLLVRVDKEDGWKGYYLTADGSKAAKQV